MQNKKVEKKLKKKVGHKVVRSIENNGYKDPRHEKEREITLLLQIFQVSTREICFREHSRIRLATKLFHTHAYLDLRV
jgi:hypothetical protein